MANRHQAREMAFQLVYEWSLNDNAFYDEKRIREYWKDRSKEDEENHPFYLRVLKGVAQYLPQIDSSIEVLLENWSLKRLDRVDLAVLRLAIFELCFDKDADRPDDAVIMNEAIELAKRFGGKDSPSFVNGILDKVAKKNLETVS
jgi:N utilization substance protein B